MLVSVNSKLLKYFSSAVVCRGLSPQSGEIFFSSADILAGRLLESVITNLLKYFGSADILADTLLESIESKLRYFPSN